MALNSFTANVLSRSKGHNSIAKAAYNSRSNLQDERTGKRYEYEWKGGVEYKTIFLPKGAPEWMRDREKLWNAVEKREDQVAERFKDCAQLARDFTIALPHELTKEQRERLAKDFARYLARKGMVVDFAIHTPEAGTDERNFHLHMMVTLRDIKGDGFGNKNRTWNERESLIEWKDKWSEMGARALERYGFEVEAERFLHGHKTLKEQRIEAIKRGDIRHADACDREAKKHMGAKASAMERRDPGSTMKGKQNREIEKRNAARTKARVERRAREKDDRSMVKEGLTSAKKVAGKTVDVAGGILDAIVDIFEGAVEGAGKTRGRLTPEKKKELEEAARERERDLSRDM
jgi:hypothetical protein